MKINLKYLLISMILVILTALLGSMFTTRNMMSWYNTLNLPSLVPPSFVFPIAWNILFVLMIVSFYLILVNNQKKNQLLRKEIINLFGIQLILNVLWVLIFFEFNLLFLGFLEIILLEIIIIYLIIKTYKLNKTAAYLLMPYSLWIVFATILNLLVFLLN
jgi:translocator protein